MNGSENSEIRQLNADELDLISGGTCKCTFQKVPGYDMMIYYGCGAAGAVQPSKGFRIVV
jgi:hypothetical protein